MGPIRKDAEQIRAIESACELVAAGHLALRCSLREGITELQLLETVETATDSAYVSSSLS